MSSILYVLKVAGKYLPLIPLYFFLVMFCIALGFDINFFTESAYNQKRLIQLSTLALLVLTLLINRKLLVDLYTAWTNLPSIVRWVLLIVAFLGALSSYQAPLPKHAFQEWSLFGLLFIFTLNISNCLSTLFVQKVVLATLAIGISLYHWRFMASAYIPSLDLTGWLKGYELFVGFVQPRFLNQIQTWILPLMPALLIVFGGVSRRYHWVLWLPGILGWTLLYASGGRATLIAMIFAAIVVPVLFARRSMAWLKVHIFFAIVGLALYLLLFHGIPHLISVEMNLPKITDRLAQAGLAGRGSLWSLAWELAWANPLLGLGPQQYANYSNYASAAHPHSAYLQWMSERGLISFALIFWLLVYGFIKWVKFCRYTLNSADGEQSILLISLTASLVAGATHALVSGVIVMPFSQMVMCIVVGWALAVYFDANTSARICSAAITRKPLSLWIVGVVFLGTILYSSYPAITQTDQITEIYLEKNPHVTVLKPRYWIQGYIGWQEAQ